MSKAAGLSAFSGWVILLAIAAAVDGLLAGASLDQSIKQLPARHRIGMADFSAYSRASDQANGLVWYTSLGIGGALLTMAAAGWSLALQLPTWVSVLVLAAGGLAVAHSLATARAAPINWSQRAVGEDELALAVIFQRFERWQTARALLQLATFLAATCALAVIAGDVSGH